MMIPFFNLNRFRLKKQTSDIISTVIGFLFVGCALLVHDKLSNLAEQALKIYFPT